VKAACSAGTRERLPVEEITQASFLAQEPAVLGSTRRGLAGG
jgi:hypothetical protein